MIKDIRWQQRLENYTRALERLQEAQVAYTGDSRNHLYQIALIGSFNFTFELAWKTLKDYLRFEGIEATTPREVIKTAFASQLITDGETWIAMLDNRNITSHAYDENIAIEAGNNICSNYVKELEALKYFLEAKKGNRV